MARAYEGAQLRADDVVEHFGVTTTHHWLLFFTNFGRVYRAKAYELPEGGRDSKGQHVANLLAFQPGEQIAKVLELHDYAQAEYLVLATRRGLVKKTRLSEYDSNRTGGLIAINLREDDDGTPDELVSAVLADEGSELLLVSRKGQAVRFVASTDQLRPDGSRHVRRHRHEVPRRRRAARDGRRRVRRRSWSPSPTAARPSAATCTASTRTATWTTGARTGAGSACVLRACRTTAVSSSERSWWPPETRFSW